MAPIREVTREEVLAMLAKSDAEKRLPITLGRYHPQAIVCLESGTWKIRKLVLDEARANVAREKALAAGDNWMPESEFAYLVPGPTMVEAPSRENFMAALKVFRWNFS